jgi:hypothetical protein
MPTPQEEALDLAHKTLPFAIEMIDKQGGFLPYGNALMANGKIEMFGATNGVERPNPLDIAKLVKSGLAAKAREGTVKATAIAQDALYTPPGGVKGDAITIQVCHAQDGYAVTYVWPYSKAGDKVTLGTGMPQRCQNDIFVPSSTPPKAASAQGIGSKIVGWFSKKK